MPMLFLFDSLLLKKTGSTCYLWCWFNKVHGICLVQRLSFLTRTLLVTEACFRAFVVVYLLAEMTIVSYIVLSELPCNCDESSIRYWITLFDLWWWHRWQNKRSFYGVNEIKLSVHSCTPVLAMLFAISMARNIDSVNA